MLHTFTEPPDGLAPGYENLAFDQAGDIYGTTVAGGMYDEGDGGTAFELTPSGAGYTENVIHSFGSGTDGENPQSGVVLDTAGNVYGTTIFGGTGNECLDTCGMVYQLMPSNGGWVENVLVNFDGTNGNYPDGNLIIDASGNLYGTATAGGQYGSGVVFKLAPSGGGFTYSVLHPFSSCGPQGGLTMDTDGNFFGACGAGGAYGDGWIFELTNCSETCTVADLHDFSGGDGEYPNGSPVLDAHGNLYGTTVEGGTEICNGYSCDVVWEIAGVDSRP